MKFKVAIPSYKRSKTIKQKTLNYLKECEIDFNNVYVFVANEDEYKDYSYLESEYDLKLVVGVPTIQKQRDFIRSYFNNGDLILSLDDDISYLAKKNGNKLDKVLNLKQIVNKAFSICLSNKTKIWGVSAVSNPFYMDDSISSNLKFIVGCFYGFINDKDDYWNNSVEVKEDYELTLKHYERFGKIIRLNGYGPVTKYYTESGGLYDIRTGETSERAALYLMNNYPDWVKLKGVGTHNHLEITIGDRKNKK